MATHEPADSDEGTRDRRELEERFFDLSLDLLCFHPRRQEPGSRSRRKISTHTNTQFSHGICPACYADIVEPQLNGTEKE